jgi:hypothetical protein
MHKLARENFFGTRPPPRGCPKGAAARGGFSGVLAARPHLPPAPRGALLLLSPLHSGRSRPDGAPFQIGTISLAPRCFIGAGPIPALGTTTTFPVAFPLRPGFLWLTRSRR